MAIDYHYLMNLPPLSVSQRYSWRETVLYALGVGAGRIAANDPHGLKFVYEQQLVALPTLATVLAYPGFWARDPKYGITWRKLLHRDQSIEIHAPIPAEGEVHALLRIDEIYDRGAEKGALLCFSRQIVDASSQLPLATVRQVNVLRADGGFGGPPDRTPPGPEPPDRAPDLLMTLPTNPDQALLYRLSGDLNPLHIDPATAAVAGFERPILHGLASFGAVGLAVVCRLCGYDPTRVRRFGARFSSPVYPGDTLEVAIWSVDQGRAIVEASVIERHVTVIRNGYVDFHA